MASVFIGRRLLDRRSAGTSVGFERFTRNSFRVLSRKTGNGDGLEQFHYRYGLWDRNVAHMTHLAMLLVRRMPVPVPGRLQGKQAHGKNQGDSQ